jgi:hypothetical protein
MEVLTLMNIHQMTQLGRRKVEKPDRGIDVAGQAWRYNGHIQSYIHLYIHHSMK